jgi:hypothetical protein
MATIILENLPDELIEQIQKLAQQQNQSVTVKAPLLTLDRKLVNSLANSTYQVCFFADFSLSPFS